MSIRYFSRWLEDEERSYIQYGRPWAWLDANISDPPPGVIYFQPHAAIVNGIEEASLDENLQFAVEQNVIVDGGSLNFIVRRSTVYIFDYTPIVLLVLGIITNAFQLAVCCRLRHKLPAVSFLTILAIADLTCILVGAGRLAIDRLFITSIDHLHPWSCKIRHFTLAFAFDLSVWLVPLGLCELWRPASRIIIYATAMSLLVNLHNLVTKGWEAQGEFGRDPIVNNCGYSFADARIFWLHIHPIVSVIINVIGPVLAAILLVLTLTFQGRCHATSLKTEGKKRSSKVLRINLLLLFALLAGVQAVLLAPTAVLSAMELFFNSTVHPSMRALVLFGQLLNSAIKLPFIFLAAPQLCSSLTESTMGFYGEKRPKGARPQLARKSQQHLTPENASESDFGDQSGLENEDQTSLVNNVKQPARQSCSRLNEQQSHHRHHSHQHGDHRKSKAKRDKMKLSAKEVAPADFDVTKPLTHATLNRNRMPSTEHQPFYYSTASRASHHHTYQQLQQPSASVIAGNQYQYPTMNGANGGTSHRHASLMSAAASAVAQGGTMPSASQQLYWRPSEVATGESTRKIYV